MWKEYFGEAVTAGHKPGVTKTESEFRVTDFVQRKTEITQVGLMSYGACHTFPPAVFPVPLAPFVLLHRI